MRGTETRDITPLQPDVWDVWGSNLEIIKRVALSLPKRAFIGKDRYDRMMAFADRSKDVQTDNLRSSHIWGIEVVIDYADRERLDFQ